MNEFGLIPENLIQAATLAWREGRLSFRCTDGQGKSCNGGKSEPLAVGEWSEAKEPELCRSGWHLTTAPHCWAGARVFLCEGEDCGGKERDKSVWRRIRPLAECDPKKVQNASVLVRCKGNLSGADLFGAVLRGAVLRDANLRGADLRCAGQSAPHAGADSRFRRRIFYNSLSFLVLLPFQRGQGGIGGNREELRVN